MTAPPSVSLQDLERAYFLAGTPAADNNLAVTMGQGIKANSTQVANKNNTLSKYGTATAPGANTNIAVLAVGVGYWRFDITIGFGGTAESTALDNFKLLFDTLNVQLPIPNLANTQAQYTVYYNEVNPGNNAVIQNTAAGSAGSVYKCLIEATQLA